MKLRRTMLFVPGNAPSMLRDALIYGPDSVMFDLEDAVSPREKDAARHLVFRALRDYDYAGVERIVRINGSIRRTASKTSPRWSRAGWTPSACPRPTAPATY
jgi:citrate lyase beta subunit